MMDFRSQASGFRHTHTHTHTHTRARARACVCVYVCVCVDSQLLSTESACAVLYCHLWTVWLYHIFPHYLINGAIFVKFIKHKRVFK